MYNINNKTTLKVINKIMTMSVCFPKNNCSRKIFLYFLKLFLHALKDISKRARFKMAKKHPEHLMKDHLPPEFCE